MRTATSAVVVMKVFTVTSHARCGPRASGLPFRRFLPAVAVDAMAWCALHIAIGTAAGEAARQIETWVGRGSWILAILLAVGVAAVSLIRRRAAARAGSTETRS
ncbi:hypothetical protein [Amycolatopsis sp. NPDC052450]|uniref:hypothetical protein n=1 Tax=Amycolatopsis sp. NPDC052450 TaxID=3363937 RepID=UPI0037CA4A50